MANLNRVEEFNESVQSALKHSSDESLLQLRAKLMAGNQQLVKRTLALIEQELHDRFDSHLNVFFPAVAAA